MLQAKVQLHVSGFRIGQQASPRCVFHPPLAAVVDGKEPPVRHVAALEAAHVEVVKAEDYAGKDIVGCHGPVAGHVAKLPDGAAVALRQQARPLVLEECRFHLRYAPVVG